MQSFAGGAILLVAGLFVGEFHALHLGAISLRSWLALAYLIVFGSASVLARTSTFFTRAQQRAWQRMRL